MHCFLVELSVCLSSGAGGGKGVSSPPAAVLCSAQGSIPTSRPNSTSGSARLLPPQAGSNTLDTSAPGDGCALCSNSGCVGDFSGRGFRGC